MQEQEIHNRENCWKTKDGEFIPVTELSVAHLRSIKAYAQRMEEIHFYKSIKFCGIAEMVDIEAQRRGIQIKDKRSKFRKLSAWFSGKIKNMQDSPAANPVQEEH